MSIDQIRILIVDDEASVRRSLRDSLTGIGFQVSEAARGEEALSFVRNNRCDAILLDMNMPGISGLETCRRLRKFSAQVPILATAVRSATEDIVAALDMGADDYMTKPINLHELIARLRAMIRRNRVSEYSKAASILSIGELELDPDRHLLFKAGRRIHLTPKEFTLLELLMSHAGKPLSHTRLLQAVWGAEYSRELEYLRTFMRQLRRKIEDDPARPRYLLTDSHIGYRFIQSM